MQSLGKHMAVGQRMEDLKGTIWNKEKSLEESPNKLRLKAQLEQLYKLISKKMISHIIESSMKPQFTQDEFKSLAQADERNTISVLREAFSDES